MTTHTSIFNVEFNDTLTGKAVTGFQMKYSEHFENWILIKNGIIAGNIFEEDMKRIHVLSQVV